MKGTDDEVYRALLDGVPDPSVLAALAKVIVDLWGEPGDYQKPTIYAHFVQDGLAEQGYVIVNEDSLAAALDRFDVTHYDRDLDGEFYPDNRSAAHAIIAALEKPME